MRWILFIFVCLVSLPTQAVTIPGVTTPTSTNAQTAPAKEPDVEQKKAAYGALADVLENDASRQETDRSVTQSGDSAPCRAGANHCSAHVNGRKNGAGKRHGCHPPLR
ncbi:putative mechanosensitive channel protein [Citrobacter braakii]|nr:putative mechanosensitive channel protein [Citrobacter braakii]